jgi:hypothetical protein
MLSTVIRLTSSSTHFSKSNSVRILVTATAANVRVEKTALWKQEDNTMAGQCATKTRRTIALGFLLTYVALLSHESDFAIAKDKGLLPMEGDLPRWADWRRFVGEILIPTVYKDVHRRFYYGELRLGRLNAIYLFVKFGFYMNIWPNYASFLRDQLGWLAATTIYIAVVLTAMQVGLATDQLKGSNSYMGASYGFSVFAIMGQLIAGFLILLALVVLVALNWRCSKRMLEWQIHEITEIPPAALRGEPLSDFSVDERLRWAEKRDTRRREDKAYCLLGIFNIFIPLIYGEKENVFIWLEEEINKSSESK